MPNIGFMNAAHPSQVEPETEEVSVRQLWDAAVGRGCGVCSIRRGGTGGGWRGGIGGAGGGIARARGEEHRCEGGREAVRDAVPRRPPRHGYSSIGPGPTGTQFLARAQLATHWFE